MEILNIVTQQETTGHSVLVVLWMTFVIVFYSLILFTFYMGMKNVFSNLIKKIGYGKV